MVSPFIPSSFVYGDSPSGAQVETIQVASRAPTSADNQYVPGTLWLSAEPAGNGNLYFHAGFVSGVPQWELLSSSAGSVVSVTGTSNQIVASPTSGAVVLTLANPLTTPGPVTVTGNLTLATLGNKIIVPTGTNASAGTSAAMTGTPGAVTVATTASSSTALIFYSRKTTGGTPGQVSITAQDGTGFTLTSTGNETSTFNWWIINA